MFGSLSHRCDIATDLRDLGAHLFGEKLWFIRYGLICPVVQAGVGVSFHSRLLGWVQHIAGALALVSGLGLIAIVSIATLPGSFVYTAGLLLIVAYVYTFFRLRFLPAVAVTWSIVVVYEASAVWLGSSPLAILLANSLLLVASNVIGMSACYAMERVTRSDFLDKQLLRSAQQRLMEREAEARQLALVARRTGDAVIILDASTRIRWVNSACERMSGYLLGDLVGKLPTQLLVGAATERSKLRQMGRAVSRGEGFTSELLIYPRCGEPRWVSLDIQPVTDDESGALSRIVVIAHDIHARMETESALRYQALHDPLTWLPNRILFATSLNAALESDHEHGRLTTLLLLLDLNHFKAVNDTRGHLAGDAVLQETARRLSQGVRGTDVVARLMG